MKKSTFVLPVLLALCIAPAAQAQIGACCFPDGSCADLFVFDCTLQGGNPQAPGTSCATFSCPVPDQDWGDAPDPTYPTYAASGGAVHTIAPGFALGSLVDNETDGLPNADATGDDLDFTADEDGITFSTALLPGSNAAITVVATAGGLLDAWIDFDQNGTWDHPQEHLFGGSLIVTEGTTSNVTFAVPAGAVVGDTFGRFRFSSSGALLPTGPADDGEVEDYKITIGEFDWGDAPDAPYPTLAASDGARHVIQATPRLGTLLDAELDGQPDGQAAGDDLNGADDEDGLTAISPLRPGESATLSVTATGAGLLDAWVDFDRNGSWEHPAEHLFGGSSQALSSGSNPGLAFLVPFTSLPGPSAVRLRISSAGGLLPTGLALDGEVEDYAVTIDGLDWGDAPDPTYPTLRSKDGPRHVITPGYNLGVYIDHEAEGQPGIGADTDDSDGTGEDDEDGVQFLSDLVPGRSATIEIMSGASSMYLDGWIDFDRDGTWEAGEHINGGVSVALSPLALTNLSVLVPAAADPGPTYARFRVSSSGGLSPEGFAPDGEVEDYAIEVVELDWGDAPDPTYATLAANNGPSHVVQAGYRLGSVIDGELDAQPDPAALGDDQAGLADEDGVIFPGPIVRGHLNCLTVIAGPGGGILNGWIDFNADGSFDHPAERLFSGPGLSLIAGANMNVCFTVPWNAVIGPTYARFRLSSDGGLTPTGPAPDGEVEDYGGVLVLQPRPQDEVKIMDIFPSAGTVVVSWNAESNIIYQLQATTNIVLEPEPFWFNVGAPVQGPAHQQSDPLAGQPDKAYRVLVPSVP